MDGIDAPRWRDCFQEAAGRQRMADRASACDHLGPAIVSAAKDDVGVADDEEPPWCSIVNESGMDVVC